MIFNLTSKKDPFLERVYNNSMKELGNFFGIKWVRNKPCVFLVKDRETINLVRNKKTEDWVVGWINREDVYILDRENYEKESIHKYSDEEYTALLKHELTHVFTFLINPKNHNPIWLWEGISIYLSGQNKFKKKPDKLKKFLDFYNKHAKEIYQESGFAVEILIKKYGKEKIIDLIKSMNETKSEKEFEEKFKEIYGFELTYKNINKLFI